MAQAMRTLSSMPRRLRCHTGGYVYHALNRVAGHATLFTKDADYALFEETLRQAQARQPIRLLAYSLMPNHWHLVLWPIHDGDLSEFLRWLTVTHTQRYHAHYHTAGTGPVYQGRFKSFPIEKDDHLLKILRYVESNPLRAGLVRRAEEWRWSSLWQRGVEGGGGLLVEGPVPLPGEWREYVNQPETESELEAMRRSVVRGCPYGEASWVERTARKLGLEATLRRPGRPKKERPGSLSVDCG
jgi:putative transposase